jgi:hypothetical protein
MTGPRDWDKEMAEIDKIIASGKASPAASPPAGGVPARAGQQAPARPATATTVTRGRDKVGVWLRTLVGAGGAVALQLWPYAKGCGTMLYLYMLSTLAVTLLGAWAMRGAWVHRRGVAHVGGLLVFLAGLTFAAIQVLERTSYAAAPLGWTCP